MQVVRVTDVKMLDAAMERLPARCRPGGVESTGEIFLINHNADNALITLRYRFPGATFDAAEEPFEAAGHKFNRGSFIVRQVGAGDLAKAAAELGVKGVRRGYRARCEGPPGPRRAHRHHAHLAEHTERRLVAPGVRPAGVPYEYISTQTAGATADLRAKYDVIVFAPGVRGNPQAIISGMPMYGNPLPWKVTQLTPNLGKTDETDDMRPGLGWAGLEHLQEFVRKGGLLITANDTTNFAVAFGFTPGVSIGATTRLKVTGSALRSKMVDAASPIVYGYRDNLAIFASNPPVFSVTSMAGGGGGGRRGAPKNANGLPDEVRPTIPIFRRDAVRWRSRKIRTRKPGRLRRSPTSSFAIR